MPTNLTNIFVKLTRVYYVNKGRENEEIKTQPVVLQKSQIESFRPRNKIGTRQNGNRTTVVTTGGRYYNVKEKFSEVQRLLTNSG